MSGLAAVTGSSGGGGSAWTTALITSLIAAVTLVAVASYEPVQDEALYCVYAVQGTVTVRAATNYRGRAFEVASITGFDAGQTVASRYATSASGSRALFGELSDTTGGVFWMTSQGSAAGRIPPKSDGVWYVPDCILTTTEEPTNQLLVELLDGWLVGLAGS